MAKKATNIIENSDAVVNNSASDIQDIDLSIIQKKKFRIDGDNNKIIELNTSDLGIVDRVAKAEKELMSFRASIQELSSKLKTDEEDVDSELMEEVGTALKDIDKKMRELVDFIFDSEICDIVAPDGTMYDPIGGKLRYEHIVDRLISLYEGSLSKEAHELSQRARKHTSKYTGRK